EAGAVKPPKVERKQMNVLDTNATAALIEAARDTTLSVPILLGVTTGMRRGEVVALRWRHVDLDKGQISVEESAEQTKTGIRYKPPKSGSQRALWTSYAITASGKRRPFSSSAPDYPKMPS